MCGDTAGRIIARAGQAAREADSNDQAIIPLPTPARNENDYATGGRVNRNNVLWRQRHYSSGNLTGVDNHMLPILPTLGVEVSF